MVNIRVDFEIEGDEIFEAFERAANEAPQLVDTAAKRMIRKVGPDIKWDFQEEPREGADLSLASPQQRKLIFARGLAGRPRTHDLSAGWKLISVFDVMSGTLVAMENPIDYTNLVMGEDQQAFFADMGWKHIDDLKMKWLPILTIVFGEELNKVWNDVGQSRP